ncbi:MAG: hypothetical protein KDD62_04840 [Bdellovibrionales bacterium]|nr:hypothetical protein [Bdellovibrionales bacterium]
MEIVNGPQPESTLLLLLPDDELEPALQQIVPTGASLIVSRPNAIQTNLSRAQLEELKLADYILESKPSDSTLENLESAVRLAIIGHFRSKTIDDSANLLNEGFRWDRDGYKAP